jgi:limonene-1,2-epoxide hydrolase
MLPYRVRSRKAVRKEVLGEMRDMQESFIREYKEGNKYGETIFAQLNCCYLNHFRDVVSKAYGYDPHLHFEITSDRNLKVIRFEEYEPSNYRKINGEKGVLCEIDLVHHKYSDVESHNFLETLLDGGYLEEVEKVLASVRAYTERGYSEVKVGDEVVAINNMIYMSDDFDVVTQGSDTFRVLSMDERWVYLRGKGNKREYVGWDKVLGVF